MIVAPRTPTWLMNETVTVTPATETYEDNGAPQLAWSSGAITSRCSLQPISGSEAVIYGRDSGTEVYQLWISPVDTGGTAVTLTGAQWKDAQISVTRQNGETLTLRAIGDGQALINLGTVIRITAERTT